MNHKLQLATVVARFQGSNLEAIEFGMKFDFGLLLMKFPAVVTVRPDGDDFTWLYRCDVTPAPLKQMETAAVLPCISVSSDLRCEVEVLQIAFLTHAQRMKFHARFY